MPVTPEIELKGIEQLGKKIARLQKQLDAGDPGSTIRQAMTRIVLIVQTRMMHYPPQRPGSSYRRTGTLGRRWTHRVTTSGSTVTGRVGNNTSYAPQVQSERFQHPVHRGRWQTAEKVIREEESNIRAEFAALAREVAREF